MIDFNSYAIDLRAIFRISTSAGVVDRAVVLAGLRPGALQACAQVEFTFEAEFGRAAGKRRYRQQRANKAVWSRIVTS